MEDLEGGDVMKWLPTRMIGFKVAVRMLNGEMKNGTLMLARDDCYVLEMEEHKLLHINPEAIGYIEQE